MNNLSLPAFLTGLVALAGILFLLQRLRVRYREQTVVTTLFWKEALMEARRRVLVRSFKHPLAYLFVLLIGSLMWLGFADPELESASARSHLVLLDGSAAMGRGDRFRETVRELQEHVSELPASRRRVVFCGGRAGSLLEPGESLLLLEERVGDLVPEACPPSVERVLRSLTRHLPPDAELEVVVAGDAPLSETMLELLPKGVRVSRLAPGSEDGERPAAPNRGITALGVGAASSGAFDRVDVLCELRGPDGETPALAVLLDGNPVELEARRSREGNRTRILLVDVPASGRLLTLHLAHDSQAGDALS
ncbi:MAG: BatA domain-containing protein, partial [Planctomycetota bacterium]